MLPANRDMLPAYRALLALLRPQLSPPLADLARSLAAPLTEPQRAWLVRRSVQEGAADWLQARHREGLLELTEPQLRQLQQATGLQTRRTLEADALRLLLRPLLHGAAAPLALIKGASVEQRCYPPGVMRHCADVDVLAADADLPALEDHLRRLGLHGVRRDPSGRTVQFAGPGAGAALDLHLRLACPRRYPRYATAEIAKTALQRAGFLRDGTKVLAPADATLHLLVHLATGLGGDLRHLADADQWLQRIKDPPLRQIVVMAEENGVHRAVRAALAWLAELPLGAVDRRLTGLQTLPGPDRALAHLQRRLVQRHYLRRGPVLPPPLSALTELLCVDFPRGAVGLAALVAGAGAGPPRP
jgi:hypothetical protein